MSSGTSLFFSGDGVDDEWSVSSLGAVGAAAVVVVIVVVAATVAVKIGGIS